MVQHGMRKKPKQGQKVTNPSQLGRENITNYARYREIPLEQ